MRSIRKFNSRRTVSVTLPAERDDLYVVPLDQAIIFVSMLAEIGQLLQPMPGIFCFSVLTRDESDYRETYSVFNFGAMAAIYIETNENSRGEIGKFMTKKEYHKIIDSFLIE